MIIAPSVLSLDYADTKGMMEQVNASKAKWLHFDVMDGHFVPNLSFGPDILKGLAKTTDLFMDVHIMVSDPAFYAPVFVKAGAEAVTYHYEACDSDETIIQIAHDLHEAGCQAGISIKPKTPVDVVLPLLEHFEIVLVMSVEPGFGGQSFDVNALDKIRTLRTYIDEHNLKTLIEVDGGINQETGALCKEAGADVLVAGSYVFKGDIVERVESLL